MGPELRPGASLPGAGPSLLDSPAFPGTAGWEVSHHYTTRLPGPPAGGGASAALRGCLRHCLLLSALPGPQRFQDLRIQLECDIQDCCPDTGAGCGFQRGHAVCAGATDAPCALCPLSVSQTSPLLADATCQGPLPCSGSGVSGRVRRVGTGGPSLQAPRLRRLTPASQLCVRKRNPPWNDRVYGARTFPWLPGGLQGSCWPCSCRGPRTSRPLRSGNSALSPSLPLSLSVSPPAPAWAWLQ